MRDEVPSAAAAVQTATGTAFPGPAGDIHRPFSVAGRDERAAEHNMVPMAGRDRRRSSSVVTETPDT